MKIMEKKMETTIMGYIGLRVCFSAAMADAAKVRYLAEAGVPIALLALFHA